MNDNEQPITEYGFNYCIKHSNIYFIVSEPETPQIKNITLISEDKCFPQILVFWEVFQPVLFSGLLKFKL